MIGTSSWDRRADFWRIATTAGPQFALHSDCAGRLGQASPGAWQLRSPVLVKRNAEDQTRSLRDLIHTVLDRLQAVRAADSNQAIAGPYAATGALLAWATAPAGNESLGGGIVSKGRNLRLEPS
jgi:hypothetical protein